MELNIKVVEEGLFSTLQEKILCDLIPINRQ